MAAGGGSVFLGGATADPNGKRIAGATTGQHKEETAMVLEM